MLNTKVGDLKISVITVTLNAGETINRCIQSVATQNYSNIEYIIIDGGSADDTLQVIDNYHKVVNRIISEPDNGIYDAMNKGIAIATGDVVGILNADDFFAADDILTEVARAFENREVEIVYGDLNYLNPAGEIVRKWVSGKYKYGMFNRGWMPPHPTFYCRREVFENLGNYNAHFGTAADYELMLRFIHLHKLRVSYLNKVMVNMTTGGVSNSSYTNRLAAWKNDYRSMRKNGVKFALVSMLFKPLRKVFQYI